MKLLLASSLTTAFLLAQSAAAFDDQLPDLRGRWVGKNSAIVAGSGAHWPANGGDFTKPGRFERDVILEIRGQDGRRLWGVTVLTTSGQTTTEPFLAELTGEGNKTLVAVDTDGYFRGELIARDRLTACYQQAGGPYKRQGFKPVSPLAVVSCFDVKRAR